MTEQAAFWAWWTSEGASLVEAAIEAGTVVDLADAITERVQAVAPGLAWELGPGLAAQHRLVVTAEGNPDLRATARRLLLAAPEATGTWEYADARGAALDPAEGGMRVGEVDVDFASIRVGATRVGNHVDVVVHHPRMRELPEQARGTVMFISLDHTLGETECETWVGNVDAALDAPVDGLTLDGLRDLVAQVRADATADDGGPVWVILRGEVDGTPLMAMAQVPLAPSWAPHLDAHLSVDVPFAAATDDGFPTDATLDQLRALEDHLAERIGDMGRLVAHETGSGRRTLHFYVDSARPTAGVAEAAVQGWSQGSVVVTHAPDPGWHGVRHLRT